MVFNVIKGNYPTLAQVDKALLKSADEDVAIERGMLLTENTDNEWVVAGGAEDSLKAGSDAQAGAFVYFALQGEDDLTAGMAGDIGAGADSDGEPKINGLACSPTNEIETDMYAFTGDPDVGDFLAVSAAAPGKLTELTTGQTAVAQLTRGEYTRWVNNAVAVAGYRTGNNVDVIRARTMYIPACPIS